MDPGADLEARLFHVVAGGGAGREIRVNVVECWHSRRRVG